MKNDILKFIRKQDVVSVLSVQNEFNISYLEAKKILDELLKEGILINGMLPLPTYTISYY